MAYGLVRDAARRAEYDRLRRTPGVDLDAAVVAAGRWAGRWWARNRRLLARPAARLRMQASRGGIVGRRVVTDAAGRVLWLVLCGVGLVAGFLLASGAGRLLGVPGPWAPLAGSLAGVLVGNQRGWHLRLRLARLPTSPTARHLGLVAAAAAVGLGLWIDSW